MFPSLTFNAVAGAAIGAGVNLFGAFAKRPESMMRQTAAARLEPNAIIDTRCLMFSGLNDVLSVATNVFIATYCQLISIRASGADGTQIIKQITLSNTSKGKDSLFASMLSADVKEAHPPIDGILEEIRVGGDELYEEALPDRQFYSQENNNRPNHKLIEGLNDQPALAVGRLVDLQVDNGVDGGKPTVVQIAIRLMNTIADTSVLKESLESRFRGTETALERKHGWKSGRLSFIGDLIFGNDQVRAHRRLLMRDKDGVYGKLTPNKGRNRSIGDLARGKFSVAEASSVLVIDQETVNELEYSMGGKFSNRTFRDRLIESTGIMTIAVIDRGDDQVTFYYDAIADGTTLSANQLRNAGKGDGPDVKKILETFLTNAAPSFR